MVKQSPEERMFVKKMAAKITFTAIGLHALYRFYQMTGMAKQIRYLFGLNADVIESCVDADDDGICDYQKELDKDVILTLTTNDETLLKFKTTGNYVINQTIVKGRVIKGMLKIGEKVYGVGEHTLSNVDEINIS